MTGTRTGLEPIRDLPEFQRLVHANDNVLAHGPMLGCVSDSSIQVWVRTAGVRQVVVVATDKDGNQVVSDPVTSSVASDHTAVVTLQGLKPRSSYAYRVRIADTTGANSQEFDGGEFKTIVPRESRSSFVWRSAEVPAMCRNMNINGIRFARSSLIS